MAAVVVAGRYVPRPPEHSVWSRQTPSAFNILNQSLQLYSSTPVRNLSITETPVWSRVSQKNFLLASPALTASFAASDTADTLTFSADAVLSTSLSAADTKDTLAFNGDVVISSSLTTTDTADVLAFNGTVGNVVSATMSPTDVADTLAFSGDVVISSSLSSTDNKDILAFSADAVLSAVLASTDTTDTASFVCVNQTITASFAITEATDTAFFDFTGGGGGKTDWPARYRRQEHQHSPYQERQNIISEAAAHMSSLGGHARAKALTSKQRSDIASKAASIRWK